MANQFLVKATMAAMRGLSAAEITALQNGTYEGVQLLGYYQKGDTPAPIEYYLSNTSRIDDGGSVVEIQGIKLEHAFGNKIDVRYFGISENLSDNTLYFTNLASYITDGQLILFKAGVSYKGSLNLVGKSINIDFNNSSLEPVNNTGSIHIHGSIESKIDVVGNPKYGDRFINVVNVGNLAINDLILLRDESVRPIDSLPDQNMETLKIASIAGDKITVEGIIKGTFVTGKVTIQKINKISNISVRNLSVKDNINNTRPLVWVKYAENITIDNIRGENTVGNFVRLDSCYGGQITNIYCFDPRLTGSGEGYGLSINECKQIYSNNIHGRGTRHIVDFKNSYDCVLENVFEPKSKSSSVVLAHNGFGGFITARNIFTAGPSYSVNISSQGFSPLNFNNQTLRGYKVENVNHTVQDRLANQFVPAVYFDGDYADIYLNNITSNFSKDIDTTTMHTSASVIRLNGDKKGQCVISNVFTRAMGTVVLLSNRTNETNQLNYPTFIKNLFAEKCINIMFSLGVGNIQIDGIDSDNVLGGALRLTANNSISPSYIDVSAMGQSRLNRSDSYNFIDPASTVVNNTAIRGYLNPTYGASLSGLTIEEGGTIPLIRLLNSSGYLAVANTINTNITLNATTPIDKGIWDGQEITIACRVNNSNETGTITIPTGANSTVMGSSPIVMRAGSICTFIFLNGTWRLKSIATLKPATTTILGQVKMSTAVADPDKVMPELDTLSTATDIEGLKTDLNDLITRYNLLRQATSDSINKFKAKMSADRASGQQAI